MGNSSGLINLLLLQTALLLNMVLSVSALLDKGKR